MKTTSVVVFIAAVLLAADKVDGGNTDCMNSINTCLAPLRAEMSTHMAQYNFGAACRALGSAFNCYDMSEKLPVCRVSNDTAGIEALKAIDQSYKQLLCNSDLTPNVCVSSLQNCAQLYQTGATSADRNIVCSAAASAIQCVQQLPCPQDLAPTITRFQQTAINTSLQAHCNGSGDPTYGHCVQDVNACMMPIESSMNIAILTYNFAGVCGLRPDMNQCYQRAIADPNCAPERTAIQNKSQILQNKYLQFCTQDNQPIRCLADLQRCSNAFNDVTFVPIYGQDALLQCQAIADLTTCVNRVIQEAASCPINITALANGLAREQLLIAQSQQMDKDCGNIITSCTQAYSNCIINPNVQMRKAEDMNDYDTVCRYAQMLSMCVNNQVPSGCDANNQYVLIERAMVTNVTTTLCDPHNPGQAKLCLQQLHSCAVPLLNAQENFPGISAYCQKESEFLNCSATITCTDSNLQAKLATSRQSLIKQQATCAHLAAGNESACMSDLNSCVAPLRQQLNQHVSQFDFGAACRVLNSAVNCYNGKESLPECQGDLTNIASLKGIDDYYKSLFCNDNLTPTACVSGLQACFRTYSQSSSSTDKTTICNAAANAMQCVQQLTCPPTLQLLVTKFEQDAVNRSLQQHCSGSPDPNIGRCENDANACALPIQSAMNMAIVEYNYVGLCSLRTDLQQCYQRLMNDSNCILEVPVLQNGMNRLQSRYSLFCIQTQPVQCLADLQTCTDKYIAVATLSMFTTDALVQCQASTDLTFCLGQVSLEKNTCPINITELTSGLLNEQILLAQSKQLDQNCGNILSTCTSNYSRCALDEYVQMQKFEELTDYDFLCHSNNRLIGCLNTPAPFGCNANNQYILAQKSRATNTSTLLCDPNQPSMAKPCLESFHLCAMPLVNAQKNFPGLNAYCSVENTFLKCTDSINCADSNLQAMLTSSRQTLQKQNTACSSLAGSSSQSHSKSNVIMVILAMMTMFTITF